MKDLAFRVKDHMAHVTAVIIRNQMLKHKSMMPNVFTHCPSALSSTPFSIRSVSKPPHIEETRRGTEHEWARAVQFERPAAEMSLTPPSTKKFESLPQPLPLRGILRKPAKGLRATYTEVSMTTDANLSYLTHSRASRPRCRNRLKEWTGPVLRNNMCRVGWRRQP
jgi:hypothetical protein